jgi:hypothetical protein
MHLVGISTLLILLSLGPGYHHPPRLGYHNPPPKTDVLASQPKLGTSPLRHVRMSSVVIRHAM